MQPHRWTRVSTLGTVTLVIVAAGLAAVASTGAAGASVEVAERTLTVGTSGDEQYDTIQAAADEARPGDTVLISGGVYQEALTPPTDGTAAAPIVFRGKPEEKVVIDGDKDLVSDNGLVNLDGRSHIEFADLTITGSPSHGVYGYRVRDIVLRDVEVSSSSDGGVVFIDGSDITVVRANVHHNNDQGLDADNEAISLSNIDGFEVKNSHVHDNGEEGIDAKYEARNGSIHHNKVVDNRGPNIYVDSAHDIDVHGNTVRGAHGEGKPGIMVAVENYSETLRTDAIAIYNNIASDNANGGIGFWIESEGTISNISIVNNTLYDNDRAGISFDTDAFEGTNTITNNILVPNPEPISGGGDQFNQQRNLTRGDPMFVDQAAGDVHLEDGSPAIDAGTTSGAPPVDLAGDPRPTGEGVDQGAYER